MIYIIYDREGCEILGIEKAFCKKEDAADYLKGYWETDNAYMKKLRAKLSFEEFCDSEIVEVNLSCINKIIYTRE